SGPIRGESIAARLVRVPLMIPQLVRAMVADHRAAAGRRSEAETLSEAARHALETLRADGITVLALGDDDMKAIRHALAAPVDALRQRRDEAGPRTFEGNQGWLNEEVAPGAHEILTTVLARQCVLD